LPCKNYRAEKLSRIFLKKTIKKLLAEKINDAEYFICGPNGLMNLAQEVLESIDIDAEKIHTEFFAPSEDEQPAVQLPQTPKEVLIHFFEQTNLLDVQPGKSILEAALEEKIPLRYSCKNGTCGSCVARHTAGNLHTIKNYALTDEEVRNGFVLLCQSYPLDDEVVVTIE
jgi:ring-1,2-phenylacetyl-CoA epoxidase subunit PaaE